MTLNLKQQKAAETKNRLIDSALRVFSAKGFGASTTKDIAKEAGVTDGLIYHYFSSKEELLWAVIDKHTLNNDLERAIRDFPTGNSLEELLLAYFTKLLDTLHAKSELIVMFFGEAQRNPAVHQRLVQLVESGMDPLVRLLTAKGVPHSSELHLAVRNIHTSFVMYFLLFGRNAKDQQEHVLYITATVKQFLKAIL